MILTTFMLALALARPAQQNCTHSIYDTDPTKVTGPGVDPGSETSAPCGQSSMTVSVTISAGLEVRVVEAGAAGSISATIETPSSCKTQRVEYSGEILGCKDSGTAICWNCDQAGAKVKVKLFQNLSPCPTLPPADLLGFLSGAATKIMGGAPLTVPCGELKDVTDEKLDEGSRVRLSARIKKCDPCDPGAEFPAREGPGQVVANGSTLTYVYQGKLESLDLPGLMEGFGQLDELGTLAISPELLFHLTAEVPGSLPPVLEDARASLGGLDWVDDLTCKIDTVYSVDDPSIDGALKKSLVILGGLRANGDFSIRIPETVDSGEGGMVPFTGHWASLEGDLYFAEEGELAGVIYPGSNGAADLPSLTELWFLQDLQAWLLDPYTMLGSAGMKYSSETIAGDTVLVRQEINWSYAPGVNPSYEAQLLLGGATEYTLDTGGAQVFVTSLRREESSGKVTVYDFAKYEELRPGSWRPMYVSVREYDITGQQVVRETSFSYTSLNRRAASPRELELPLPVDHVWYIRLK